MKSAIQKAVDVAGSQTALARKLKLTPQRIQQWVSTGKVPAERVLDVEAAVGGLVTRFELRPDIYPRLNADRRASDKQALPGDAEHDEDFLA